MYFHGVFFRTDGARTAQPDAAESDAAQLPQEDDGEPGDPATDLEPPPRAVPQGRLYLHLLHGLRGRGQPHPDQVQDPIRHLPQVRKVFFFGSSHFSSGGSTWTNFGHSVTQGPVFFILLQRAVSFRLFLGRTQ